MVSENTVIDILYCLLTYILLHLRTTWLKFAAAAEINEQFFFWLM